MRVSLSRASAALLVLLLPAACAARGQDAAGIAGRWLITAYQVALSPLLAPNTCNFEPSCSRFTSRAIAARGIIAGSVIGADRLLRCHPRASAESPAPASVRPPVAVRHWTDAEPGNRNPESGTSFGFARWLQEQGDPGRAGLEYARLGSILPDSADRVRAALLAGEAFLEAGQPDLARSLFASALPNAPNPGQYGIARAEFLAGRYDDSRRALAPLGPDFEPGRTALIGWSLFRERNFPAAAAVFREHPEPELCALAAFDGRDLSRRRPAVAGILSAFLPGAGQVYAGRTWDGIYSLVTVGGAGFLTWWFASDPTRDRARVKTAFFGTTTALFHAGNIYGATAAARLHNLRQEQHYIARAEELLARVRLQPRHPMPGSRAEGAENKGKHSLPSEGFPAQERR